MELNKHHVEIDGDHFYRVTGMRVMSVNGNGYNGWATAVRIYCGDTMIEQIDGYPPECLKPTKDWIDGLVPPDTSTLLPDDLDIDDSTDEGNDVLEEHCLMFAEHLTDLVCEESELIGQWLRYVGGTYDAKNPMGIYSTREVLEEEFAYEDRGA